MYFKEPDLKTSNSYKRAAQEKANPTRTTTLTNLNPLQTQRADNNDLEKNNHLSNSPSKTPRLNTEAYDNVHKNLENIKERERQKSFVEIYGSTMICLWILMLLKVQYIVNIVDCRGSIGGVISHSNGRYV